MGQSYTQPQRFYAFKFQGQGEKKHETMPPCMTQQDSVDQGAAAGPSEGHGCGCGLLFSQTFP